MRPAYGLLALAGAAALCVPSALARDLCEILRDKGVLTGEAEFEECRAAMRAEAEEAVERKAEEKVEEQKETAAPASAPQSPAWPEWLERLSFFGDVRVRHEGFYQSGRNARNRERVRLRFGGKISVSEEVEGGLRLVSGDPDDPISTNQTLSDLFSRKPVNLDWMYVTVRPSKTLGLERPWLSLTGGKFAVPTFRPKAIMSSELVYDDDLSPEGFHEVLTPFESGEGLLRKLALHSLQWVAREQSSDEDAWVFGGQGVLELAPFPGTKLVLGLADYYFHAADLIAQEANDNDDLSMTNSVVLQDGTVRAGLDFDPDAANPIAGYLGGFNIINPSVQLQVETGFADWPFTVMADLAHNTEAVRGNDMGVWVGAGLGGAKSPGRWGVSALWTYVETDAVVSAFNYSDIGGTNRQGPVLKIDYMPLPHLTLTAKNHFISFVDRPMGESQSTLYRLQLDGVLGF